MPIQIPPTLIEMFQEIFTLVQILLLVILFAGAAVALAVLKFLGRLFNGDLGRDR